MTQQDGKPFPYTDNIPGILITRVSTSVSSAATTTASSATSSATAAATTAATSASTTSLFRTIPTDVTRTSTVVASSVTAASTATFLSRLGTITAHVTRTSAVVASPVTAAAAATATSAAATSIASVHSLLLRISAILAANRLIIKALTCMELLLFGCEGKVSFAITARQGLVDEGAFLVGFFCLRVVFAGPSLLVATLGNLFRINVRRRYFFTVRFRIRCHGYC
mmetsp:Transcript_5220/g.6820  ORF Transcript_5220/g.6820 Transcript_5220/m.6820 type:complete len:225 (+) Transcript_5220:213-887(+)